MGAALAAALATSIPSALTGVAGLDTAAADKLANQTVQSAGGVIEQMRVHGTGEHPKEVVEALSSGFAHAITTSLWAPTVFLVIGLISSILLVRHSRPKGATSAVPG